MNFYCLAPYIFSLVSLAIYLVTMSHDVLPIDAGELAAVQHTLGVAHPTGYPLFTYLGFLWSKIPLATSVIVRLNILSAVFCAIGNFFLFKTFLLLFQNNVEESISIKTTKARHKQSTQSKKNNTIIHPLLIMLVAVVGTSFAAFSKTYWLQSAGVEVYSLHIALISAVLYYVIFLFQQSQITLRQWIIAGLLLGLCFSNHMTSVLLMPGLLFLIFKKSSTFKLFFTNALKVIGAAAIVVLFFYSSLMILSSSQSLFNWGNVSTVENLFRHITGKQYQVWMFSSSKAAADNLEMFIQNFPDEFSLIGVGFMIAGAIYMARKNKNAFWFFVVSFFTTIFYSINYSIKDLLPYFLLAFVSAAVFMGAAMRWIFEYVENFQSKPSLGFLVLGIPIFLISFNFSKTNQRESYYVGDYTREALLSVEPGALILSYQWDVLISPAYYYQHVEKLAPGLMILDKELLRRSWYYIQIERWEPQFFNGIEQERNSFLEALKPFEQGEKYNAAKIQQSFEKLITAILTKHYQHRPVYLAPEVLANEIRKGVDVILPDSLKLVPQKYFYRLTSSMDYIPKENHEIPEIRFPARDDLFTKSMKNSILTVLTDRLAYELSFQKQEDANQTFRMIQSIKEDVPPPPGLKVITQP
ncbi:MAG: DUF2723 domain-containing protein [Flavobacteriales bacterium]|nr:DUF2723 domain-containing protein [Flavobacteriales bacterium]